MSAKTVKELERVRYYPRQLMTAEDMNAEQEYLLERMRRHNRLFHGWGILCGLRVEPAATPDKPWNVCVCPGYACCPGGDEVHVGAPVPFDLARPPAPEGDDCAPCPCPPSGMPGETSEGPSTYYLAIRYLCRATRPVRTSHANCSCGDAGCETSRLRDSFELTLLTELPDNYKAPPAKLTEWLSQLRGALETNHSLLGLPTRPCDPLPTSDWVILSTLTADLTKPPPGDAKLPLNRRLGDLLTDEHRRLLPRVQDLILFGGSL